MALKKGVCKNFTQCTLADTKPPVIQEVDSSEFKCAECGLELYEYTGEGEKPFPKRIVFIIVAIIILIGGGIWAYFGLIKDRPPKPEESVSLSLNKEEISLYVGKSDTLIATVSTQPSDAKVSVSFTSDNLSVVNLDNNGVVKAIGQGEACITVIARMESGIADTIQVKIVTKEVEKDSKSGIGDDKGNNTNEVKIKKHGYYCTIPFDWFIYEGPCNNGKPENGHWGKMRVTRKHTIDLKDGRGGTLEVNRDDVFVDPEFRDGKWMLRGELHRTDGTRRVL